MKLLVLGGTVFLSKAVAEEAVRRGPRRDLRVPRRVRRRCPTARRTCRGTATEPAPAELTDVTYDAVVDVARHPSRVRAAVAALPGRALGVRVDDQRLRRQRASRAGAPA